MMRALFQLRRSVALLICPELDMPSEPNVTLPSACRAPRAEPLPTADFPGRTYTQSLVALAEAYAAHKGLKLSTVATYAAQDGKFFKSLGEGAGCTLNKASRVVDYFHQNWPPELEWPHSIPRPRSPKKEAA